MGAIIFGILAVIAASNGSFGSATFLGLLTIFLIAEDVAETVIEHIDEQVLETKKLIAEK